MVTFRFIPISTNFIIYTKAANSFKHMYGLALNPVLHLSYTCDSHIKRKDENI